MDRRGFLKSSALGAGLGSLGRKQAAEAERDRPLGLTPCINQATTMRAEFRTAIEAYRKAGFRQVELWLESVRPFVEKESAAAARRVMAEAGIEPVSSCCEGDLFFPRVKDRAKRLESFKQKLQLSSELGARRFVMYSAIFEDVSAADYPAALPGLREIGDMGKQFGIVVGIEFIRSAKFLGCLPTTAELVRKAAHPNLGVLLDTFHFYAGTSKLEDIEKLRKGEISFVHANDVPGIQRELLQDRDRVYLGEGIMPLERIFRALSTVYQGPVSFEVFQYAGQDPYEVARKSMDGLARLLERVEAG